MPTHSCFTLGKGGIVNHSFHHFLLLFVCLFVLAIAHSIPSSLTDNSIFEAWSVLSGYDSVWSKWGLLSLNVEPGGENWLKLDGLTVTPDQRGSLPAAPSPGNMRGCEKHEQKGGSLLWFLFLHGEWGMFWTWWIYSLLLTLWFYTSVPLAIAMVPLLPWFRNRMPIYFLRRSK